MLYDLQAGFHSQLCLFWDIIYEKMHSLWIRKPRKFYGCLEKTIWFGF